MFKVFKKIDSEWSLVSEHTVEIDAIFQVSLINAREPGIDTKIEVSQEG